MPTTIAVGSKNVTVMLSRSNYKQYRDHQVDKACLDGLQFGSEIALSQAKGFSITPTTTKAEIKTAFDKEIARQRTATIALVKEETEIYDIAIGQQVDGVVLFPLGEQAKGTRRSRCIPNTGDARVRREPNNQKTFSKLISNFFVIR